MNKKFKYTSLVAAGAVTLGLVGGTLAWFTSQDVETNVFSTGGNPFDDEVPFAGIDIVEDWIENEALNITPGKEVNKDVQVKNTVNYPQFIKVTFTKQFVKQGTNEVVTQVEDGKNEDGSTKYFPLDTNLIVLNLTNHVEKLTANTELTEGTWYELNGTYYYYGKVAPVGETGHTNTLLDSVTLHKDADNHYKGLGFKVIVNADSIQASNGAASDEWFKSATNGSLLETLKDGFKALESGKNTTPVDSLEEDGNKTDDGHDHTTPDVE